MRISVASGVLLLAGAMVFGCEPGGAPGDECLNAIPCVGHFDCDSGQHCNTALATPTCQILYCGQVGTQCSEGELCASGICNGDLCREPDCEPDCGLAECGLDPVCKTQNCGTCDNGKFCHSGKCKGGTVVGEMVLIPAGSFWMGCNASVDADCDDCEYPYHEVFLSGYYIDVTEVTQGAFSECVEAGECEVPKCTNYEEMSDWDPLGSPNQSVTCVNWFDAVAYCTWVDKRLPTEAEWEKAARGTDGRKYPWGNDTATCGYAVMWDQTLDAGCGTFGTLDVCSRSPSGDSPYGLCDMAGNAMEWVWDWYYSDYYESSPLRSPTGPDDGLKRVLRGGGYDFSDFTAVRASSRSQADPSTSDVFRGSGFRCARDAE